jgi:hypothetical protein
VASSGSTEPTPVQCSRGWTFSGESGANLIFGGIPSMAVEGLDQGLSMIVPGRADLVMQTVLALGFRVEEAAERAYFKDLVSS